MGIDPGTHRCGWGVVRRRGNRFEHLGHGVVRAPAGAPLPERLAAVAEGLEAAVAAHSPASVAIEQAFVAKDARAALMIGHARGVAMLVAARRSLPVTEYPPSVVKRAVAGNGRADKEQVAAMIRAMLGLTETPPLDASDALAVALCHASASALLERLAKPAR